MNKDLGIIRDRLTEKARLNAAFEGWTLTMLEDAAMQAGYDRKMARAVFPGGVAEAIAHHAALADRQMLEVLRQDIPDPSALRIRERIAAAVMTRFRLLLPFRESERRALSYWAIPTRNLKGMKILWRTADAMWIWAGDQAKDYNHYTKRALLSGVIASSKLVWLEDKSPDLRDTESFVARRIDNVLKLGQTIGKFKESRKAG